jgi:hypothetical protein
MSNIIPHPSQLSSIYEAYEGTSRRGRIDSMLKDWAAKHDWFKCAIPLNDKHFAIVCSDATCHISIFTDFNSLYEYAGY